MENKDSNTGFFSKNNDLKNRIFFTILMLCVYRLGTYIPLSGIDTQSLQTVMDTNQKGLLGMFNVFSGGAVSRMAIFALGIMPYISSSIIVQLLTGVSDYFKNLKKQGEIGRKKNYTIYTLRDSSTCLRARLRSFSRFRKFKCCYKSRKFF